MKTILDLACGVLLISSMSCGGRIVEGENEGPTSGNDSDSGSRGPNFQDHDLAKCEESLAPSEPCDWLVVATSNCYATKEQACACACPRDRDSTCVSGFYAGVNGRTRVSCF